MNTAQASAPSNIAGRESAPPRPLWHVILVRPETMTLALLVIAFVIASQLSPFFLDAAYILRSFTLSAEFAIVALVLTLVIIAGEIDLSPAANLALSACLFAWAQASGIPMPLAIAIGLLSGLAMGAFNALMVIRLQLPSIIVTIGTLILYRGLAQVIAGEQSSGTFLSLPGETDELKERSRARVTRIEPLAPALQPMLQLAPQIVLECRLHLVSIILHHFIFQGHPPKFWLFTSTTCLSFELW